MKNATKRPRRKLSGFAEQLSATAAPADTTAAQTIEPVVETAAPPKPASAKSAPAPVLRPATPPVTAPKPQAPPRRSGSSKGVWITLAALFALLVGGPPVIMIASALAYPFVILIGCLAIWKIYDLFQTS